MAADYCDYSDLPTDQCSHCRPQVEVAGVGEKTGGFRRGVGIRAEFAGTCPGCPDPIEVGDLIARDDEDRWTHKECV